MSNLEALFEQLADVIARRVIELQAVEATKAKIIYLTPEQMAGRMGVTVKTLANQRSVKKGPKFVKVGGAVRYPVPGDEL